MILPQSQQKLDEHFLHVILLHPPYFCMLAPHLGHGCTLPLALIHTSVWNGGVGTEGIHVQICQQLLYCSDKMVFIGLKHREGWDRVGFRITSKTFKACLSFDANLDLHRRERGREGRRKRKVGRPCINKPSSHPLSFVPLLHPSF